MTITTYNVFKSAARQHRDAANSQPHMASVHIEKAEQLEAKAAAVLAQIEAAA